jgi:hypothetical protein
MKRHSRDKHSSLHIVTASMGNCLTHKLRTKNKRLGRDKHSSLQITHTTRIKRLSRDKHSSLYIVTGLVEDHLESQM